MEQTLSLYEQWKIIKKKKFRVKTPYFLQNTRIIYFKNNMNIDIEELDKTIGFLITSARMCGYTVECFNEGRGYGWQIRDQVVQIEFRPPGVKYDEHAVYFDKRVFNIDFWLDSKDNFEYIDLKADTYKGMRHNESTFISSQELLNAIHKYRVFEVRQNTKEEMYNEINNVYNKMDNIGKELTEMMKEIDTISERSQNVMNEKDRLKLNTLKEHFVEVKQLLKRGN